MGVTYKLRQDIVDFIVQTKKSDPALSCRGLVGVVKKNFDVDVSKSSVNAVIKHFELSGPIGRHSLFKAPKNFAIPKDKKDILLKNVQTFLPAVVPPVQVVLPEPLPAPIPEPIVPLSVSPVISEPVSGFVEKPLEFVEVAPDEVVMDKDEDLDLALRADPLSEPEIAATMPLPDEALVQVEEKINAQAKEDAQAHARASVWLGDKGRLYGRLGAAALWYAFRAACSVSRLGEVLAREIGPLPDGVTEAQCEALFFADLFAEHRPGFESDDLGTLWYLAGLEDRQGRSLLDKAAVFDGKKALYAAIHAELSMAFTPVRYFRLLTVKGAHFYLDAARPVLHHERIEPGYNPDGSHSRAQALPVFTAVERGVDRIITNMAPLMADVPAAGLTPGLLEFIHLMEGYGEDAIASLELIGDDDTRCAEFQSIPSIRRGFILRVRLTDSELSRVEYEMIDNRKVFNDIISSRSCGYFEGALAVEGVERPLRVLTVKPDGWGDEFVILSNISGFTSSAEHILTQFFYSEMSIDVGNISQNIVFCDVIAPHSSSIAGIFRDIDIFARKFVQDASCASLSWKELCQRIYDLSGHIKERPEAVFLRFELPEDFAYRVQLSSLINFLNNAIFKTADGRRVVFSV